jgi:hypothetical protein
MNFGYRALWKSVKSPRKILAFDSLSGLTAGSLTWAFAPLLQTLHQWTPGFIYFIATANLVYGLYSGLLWLRCKRLQWDRAERIPKWPLQLHIAANSLWALQCLFQVWRLRTEASYFGLGHLLFEGLYVGILAYIEAKVFLLRTQNLGR